MDFRLLGMTDLRTVHLYVTKKENSSITNFQMQNHIAWSFRWLMCTVYSHCLIYILLYFIFWYIYRICYISICRHGPHIFSLIFIHIFNLFFILLYIFLAFISRSGLGRERVVILLGLSTIIEKKKLILRNKIFRNK